MIFVSEEYRDRKWTIHETRSPQARALEEGGNEYILPIRVHDIELEGLLPTIGFVPLNAGIQQFGEMLVKKLRSGSYLADARTCSAKPFIVRFPAP